MGYKRRSSGASSAGKRRRRNLRDSNLRRRMLSRRRIWAAKGMGRSSFKKLNVAKIGSAHKRLAKPILKALDKKCERPLPFDARNNSVVQFEKLLSMLKNLCEQEGKRDAFREYGHKFPSIRMRKAYFRRILSAAYDQLLQIVENYRFTEFQKTAVRQFLERLKEPTAENIDKILAVSCNLKVSEKISK